MSTFTPRCEAIPIPGTGQCGDHAVVDGLCDYHHLLEQEERAA